MCKAQFKFDLDDSATAGNHRHVLPGRGSEREGEKVVRTRWKQRDGKKTGKEERKRLRESERDNRKRERERERESERQRERERDRET